MKNEFTAVIKEEGDFWIGWIEEIQGVNCQEKTYQELIETLKVTLIGICLRNHTCHRDLAHP